MYKYIYTIRPPVEFLELEDNSLSLSLSLSLYIYIYIYIYMYIHTYIINIKTNKLETVCGSFS